MRSSLRRVSLVSLRTLILVLLVGFAGWGRAQAAVFTVGPAGDYPTLSAALAEACLVPNDSTFG